jgi:hypothetical protein
MSADSTPAALDVVRLTFRSNPLHSQEIEAHLVDQGCDVLLGDDGQFLVTWDEPTRDVDEVIEEIWEINEEPFEITLEEFQRLSLLTVYYEDQEVARTSV